MQKQMSLHHSVTELGNIQVRQVTEYVKDGKVIDKQYGPPMTPADTGNMEGWDDRSIAIVVVIITPETIAEFEAEKQEMTGTGIEEIVAYDRVIEEDGKIAVRRVTKIFDGGEEISKKYHRTWIMPGDDPTGNDVMSKAVADKIHTPEVITAYNDKIAKVK